MRSFLQSVLASRKVSLVFLILFFSICWQFAALASLGAWQWPTFHVWGRLFAQHAWLALLTGFLFALTTRGLLFAFYRGGVGRVLASMIAVGLVAWYLLTQAVLIGVSILDDYQQIPTPFELGTLIVQLFSYPELLQHLVSGLLLAYGAIVFLIIATYFKKQDKAKRLLGSAQFATVWQVAKQKLLGKKGLVLGKYYGQTLRFSGFESMLVVAPSGSGKTAGVAVPNLIEWQGSIVVNDLKGELFELTHQYRSQQLNQQCVQFAPADSRQTGARYNSFAYVDYESVNRIRGLQRIAEVIIPEESASNAAFWQASSRELLMMLAIYLFEEKGMATFAEIYDLAKQANFFSWVKFQIGEEAVKEPVFYQLAHSLMATDEEKTRGNMLRDFHMRMTLFADPIIRYATSGNDFDLRKLRKIPLSIYVTIPDVDKLRLKHLLTLFWTQVIQLMTESMPMKEEEPHAVLLLLDEMGVMAPMPVLKNGLSFLRSYRVQAIVMVQYLGQLISAYDQHDAKSFLNAKVKLAFALNDLDDANYFAKALGVKTVRIKTKSANLGRGRSNSLNEQYQSKPLMSVDSLMRMKKNQALLLIESQQPMKIKKLFWFEEKNYDLKPERH